MPANIKSQIERATALARSLAGPAIKTVLSLLLMAALWPLARISTEWWQSAPPIQRTETPRSSADPRREHRADGDSFKVWPDYPGATGGRVHRSTVNGVETISQNWTTTSQADAVLGYYKSQMLARGWQDVTEETFNLEPETQRTAQACSPSQDQGYLKKYRAITSASLVLSRGDWSISFIFQPIEIALQRTDVRVLAASTPSLRDLESSLLNGFSPDGALNSDDHPLDMTQEHDGQSYHTVISVKNAPPLQAFNDELSMLRSEHWQPRTWPLAHQRSGGYFASLTRGNQYASLAVSASPHGRDSSVTFTEVTAAPTQAR